MISSLANYSAVQAKGMITDGSATAIAVYSVGINTPVTFTGTDGVQFETWNPSFLSYQPSMGNCGGQCTITVNPFQGSDGSYYAFALVQSPQHTKNPNYGYQVAQVTASVQTESGVAVSVPSSLSIAPTPVIFVHGLWANASTFNELVGNMNMTLPWSNARTAFAGYDYNPLIQLCYDATISFDSSGVPASNTFVTPNCEKTSAIAIGQTIGQIQQSMDAASFAGGRVDAVVHSMGGLATCHYFSTSDYNSSTNQSRSRTTGPLRTIITLDTPETGSPLATALITPSIANGTCRYTVASPFTNSTICDYSYSPPGLIWREACRSDSPNVTLKKCMAKIQKPLGPGSDPTNINSYGAVASISPGSPSLASSQLPRIDAIQNQYVKWFGIESDWRDQAGTDPLADPSMMRAFFNELLSDLRPNGPIPSSVCGGPDRNPYASPTMLCLMGNDPDSDVLVPTSSQSDDTTSSNRSEFLGDAHTSMGNWFTQLFIPIGGKSDANILDGRADNCVEDMLLTWTLGRCPPAGPSGPSLQFEHSAEENAQPRVEALPGESIEDARQRNSLPLRLNARSITAESEHSEIQIGSAVHIHLDLPPGQISTILYSVDSLEGDSGDGIRGAAKIVEDNGLDKTIEVLLRRLGKMQVTIHVVYADNTEGSTIVAIDVLPESQHLLGFQIDQGFTK